MRIQLVGDCPTAKVIRGYLRRHDFHLTDCHPDWIVHVEEPEGLDMPALDGVGGALETVILRHLRKHTAGAIEIRTARTVSSEREVRVMVPSREPDRKAVETSVFRALLELAGQQPSRSRWWTVMLKRKIK